MKRNWQNHPLWGVFFTTLFFTPVFLFLVSFARAEPKLLTTRTSDVGVAVRKPTTETLASTTAFQDDDHLFFYAEANSTYEWEAYIYVSSHAGGASQITWSGPTSPTFVRTMTTVYYGVVVTGGGVAVSPVGTAWGYTNGGIAVGATHLYIIEGYVETGAAAGPVKLQWAQASSSINSASVLAGSHLTWKKL